MKPIQAPKTLQVYQLIKQTGMSLMCTGPMSSSMPSLGIGFYSTLQEAEHARTMQALSDSTGGIYHVVELEIPNPAYKGNE